MPSILLTIIPLVFICNPNIRFMLMYSYLNVLCHYPFFFFPSHKLYLFSSFRSCSSSRTSWHFSSSITSSSPSHSMLLWRCRSSWGPFSLSGIWTFTTRRVTRKLRSIPLTSMKSWGRYGLRLITCKLQRFNDFAQNIKILYRNYISHKTKKAFIILLYV